MTIFLEVIGGLFADLAVLALMLAGIPELFRWQARRRQERQFAERVEQYVQQHARSSR